MMASPLLSPFPKHSSSHSHNNATLLIAPNTSTLLIPLPQHLNTPYLTPTTLQHYLSHSHNTSTFLIPVPQHLNTPYPTPRTPLLIPLLEHPNTPYPTPTTPQHFLSHTHNISTLLIPPQHPNTPYPITLSLTLATVFVNWNLWHRTGVSLT